MFEVHEKENHDWEAVKSRIFLEEFKIFCFGCNWKDNISFNWSLVFKKHI